MERKRLYEPGDMVATFTGQTGIVLSKEELGEVSEHFKEGHRPGRYFAPGCCHNPDYVTQIPIFFEDGTFDVMRSMNIRKKPDASEELKDKIKGMMRSYG